MEIKQKKRHEITDEYKWRLNDLIPSDEAWQEGIDSLAAAGGRIEQFARFKGRLGEIDADTKQAGVLLECLRENDSISEIFSRLYVYANMKMHENTADTKYQGFADIASQTYSKCMAATAFLEPEILAIDEKLLLECIDKTPGLLLYRHYLEDMLRKKAHIRSAEVEEVLANAIEIGEAPDSIFSMLDDADLKFADVTDESGNKVSLTHSRYRAFLESPDREVRKNAWNTYYDSYWYLKNTLAAAYGANVKKDIFFSKQRGYASSLEAALFANNIPTSVYTGLLEAIHESLPQMHRYMAMRKKAMNLPELRVYDLYTPMVKNVDSRVEYNDAVVKVLEGLHPLGKDYVDAARKGLQGGGWTDVYENEGKRSGAYSWGAYGGHPYILLNYENKVDDMFTLAHELGHAMHSYYSWETQPYTYADYTIFLAEVASTVNEALLMDHMLKETKDRDMRAYLINSFLEQFRTTVFRQTLFAEFEMIAHNMAEEGKPLTVDALNKVYRELNAKYYGETLVMDDKLDLEWARIPHFYRAFYVYQYATGYSAAMAFAKRILGKTGTSGADNAALYIEFLKSGSKDYSIEILKKAGVDMSTPDPVREALSMFKDLLDEMEKSINLED